MSLKSGIALAVIVLFLSSTPALSQCTTLGQNPSTAFPVCGTTTFNQTTVPICGSTNLFVPGCQDGANYANKNPFWYKFTCYVSGSLGFTITPNAANEDYDWQLFDITGHNPDDVFTDHSLVVTGNWSGNYGATGAAVSGANFIQCASDPATQNTPTFAAMPALIAGHEYLLLVSHYTDTQSGYALSFGGGTAVITDPKTPHMLTATTSCDGTKIIVKLNKKMKCSSLSTSEFSISPAAATVTSVATNNCSSAFDFDELTITLSAPLPTNIYQLIINNGVDLNTLLDYCDRNIPAGEQVSFTYTIPQPIFADSIGRIGCAPDSVRIYFPKKINCNTIAANGSDFAVTGPTPVTVIAASGDCVNGKTDYIVVKFATPVYTKGNYQLTLKAGTDGTTVIDECGIEAPLQMFSFTAADTVSAAFTYNIGFDCRSNTLLFSHNGAHDVNKWNWTFNNAINASTQNYTIVFPAASSNTVRLIVSNGVCTDSVTNTIVLDNEVKAAFEMPAVICPEDPLTVTNTSTGLIDTWRWNFDVAGSSAVKDPAPLFFPQTNIESYYVIKLTATNNTLGCSDSLTKTLRVLNNCFIAVPTAFTPNGDGLNDYLYPNNAIKARDLQFSVYNRWGQLVFTSRDWQKKWDGKINSIPQTSGVYVWFLSYTHMDTGQKVFQKGTTTLIR